MIDENDASSEYISKTQRKHEMLELQKLGEALIKLSDSQLEKLALPTELLDSIYLARTLKTHEAKRRHLQYIGKLMRRIDTVAIKIALKELQFHHEKQTTQFHLIEEWRDELIAKGDTALQKFITSYPEADRKHLRQLIRKAQHDQTTENDTGGPLELFRYLREILEGTK